MYSASAVYLHIGEPHMDRTGKWDNSQCAATLNGSDYKTGDAINLLSSHCNLT